MLHSRNIMRHRPRVSVRDINTINRRLARHALHLIRLHTILSVYPNNNRLLARDLTAAATLILHDDGDTGTSRRGDSCRHARAARHFAAFYLLVVCVPLNGASVSIPAGVPREI